MPHWGIPELPLGGLDERAAAELLADRVPDLGPAARDRIIAQSRDNPLALLELAACRCAGQQAGEFLPDFLHLGAQSPSSRAGLAFRQRITGLAEGTRTALAGGCVEPGRPESQAPP